MYRIVVYLKEDYSENEEFVVLSSLTREEILKEVNKRYDVWYFYDII